MQIETKSIYDDRIVFHDKSSEVMFPEEEFLVSNNKLVTQSRFELGNHFQGDIRLSQEQEDELLNPSSSELRSTDIRTGKLHFRYRWPKNSEGFVNIPYKFDAESNFSKFLILIVTLLLINVNNSL
jgi:hypothetical protein